ncbi:cytochrome P450 / NADPH-cytochrome P450 reductase [Geosmithia morbida]|uniref:Bifunctional cytochrome P450/NADPH--P450 reductase n=1 Tax=Geosmithia morbida TaxID=1094350 RepID=A0A9P4YSK8_9HYPO|nr:cytochrome P450 / NADPH-cytochrome P450 reductase [Geosmithia morbida]KAF4120958.1 cytochrome P450 / NADPH-cytochrome P450 reductase [Geosmithia morbida]
MAELVPVPEPPGLPLIGHTTLIDSEFPLGSFLALSEKYGEIFRLRFPGRSVVFVSTHALADEICDERRFKKVPTGALTEVRNGVNDGLFTAHIEEPNWGIAHRVLMPAFGPLNIRAMFGEMHDISTQLAMKWARHGPREPILASEDFTRLTLDAIALCAMGFRFNSFYSYEMHPFLDAMASFLKISGDKTRRALPAWYYRKTDEKFKADIEILRRTADEVLQGRKAGNSDRKDLLNAMLKGVDPQTGQSMTDQSITDNLITFLIAGHETTSGLLSYVFYLLLQDPRVYRKAQDEVDNVIGKGPIKVEHMSKLPYIAAAWYQVLRETLRLQSTIPIIGLKPIGEQILGGKYKVNAGEGCVLMMRPVHTDPAVYGDDALEFKPERMVDENFEKLPKNAWKPFGNGVRACIGRPFAWQEALMVMAMLLQNFNFVMDDPSYRLTHKQTLTIKPKDFYIRAILRDGLTPTSLSARLAGTPNTGQEDNSAQNGGVEESASGPGQPISVFYGSNSGTCETLARRIAADAPRHGFKVTAVDCMDVANGNIPKDQPVVFLTASYEGEPPDNARHFVSYLENLEDKKALEGVNYAVFGCGHHDWTSTFYRIPKLVDSALNENGATRLAESGFADAGGADVFVAFETWEDSTFWPALKEKYGIETANGANDEQLSLTVAVTNPRSEVLHTDVQLAQVIETRILTADGEPIKKHIEIKLPSDSSYRSGDYLAVLPINPRETVARAMRRFELPWDSHLEIEGGGHVDLPTEKSLPAFDIFGSYVELAQPATKRNILALAASTEDEADKAMLKDLADASYEKEILEKRMSVLDLLETYPSAKLSLGSFLAMLPRMRIRQYSISSSPLWKPNHVTLTFSLLNEPSKSGHGSYVGVATSYLASLQAGDKLPVSIKQSHASFHLPQDQGSTPIICVAAGTGLAPFRGFIQERAALIEAGRKVAPLVLYYGCREPGRDDLYADELAKWEKLGAVKVKHTYSRTPDKSDGNKYVQEAIWADRREVGELWENGAKVFVCGSKRLSTGVQDVAIRMTRAKGKLVGKEVSEEEAFKWWQELRNVRYATDVFE